MALQHSVGDTCHLASCLQHDGASIPDVLMIYMLPVALSLYCKVFLCNALNRTQPQQNTSTKTPPSVGNTSAKTVPPENATQQKIQPAAKTRGP